MSKKVEVFFETFRVDYEGINLGANCDLLPSSLVGLIEDWIAAWDPRQLNPLSRVWFREPVCEHSIVVRKDQESYLDARQCIAENHATYQRMVYTFGKTFTQLDLIGKSAQIESWRVGFAPGAHVWDMTSYCFRPLL